MEAVSWIGDRAEYQCKVDILLCGEKYKMKTPKAEAWAAFPARALEELQVFFLQDHQRGISWAGFTPPVWDVPSPAPRAMGLKAESGAACVGPPVRQDRDR